MLPTPRRLAIAALTAATFGFPAAARRPRGLRRPRPAPAPRVRRACHRGRPLMAIVLALAAALLFALGSALQRRIAVEGSSLRGLVRRPPWLAGIAADAAGFAAQAAALAVGRLAVVQPLLASTLVFALPLERRRVRRSELAAALAVAAGLALFVTIADPAGGRTDASPAAWMATFAACAGLCALLRRGAVGLGCATGVLFGLSAALTKVVVGRLDEGVLHALIDWHVLALIVVGAVEPGALPGLAARRLTGHGTRRADVPRRRHEPADRRARVRRAPAREPVRHRARAHRPRARDRGHHPPRPLNLTALSARAS